MRYHTPPAVFCRLLTRAVIGLALLLAGGCQNRPGIKTPSATAAPAAATDEVLAKGENPAKAGLGGFVFEAVSVGRVAGVPVALMDIDGNLSVVMTGILLMTHRVEEIDVEGRRVVLRDQEKPPVILTVTPAGPIQWPEMPRAYGQLLLTTEGIKQMNAFAGMPPELGMIWNKVTREGQVEVLFGYLRRGLVVGVVASGNQRSTGFSAKLFEKQIADEVPVKKAAFLVSLSLEQRELHEAQMTLVRFADPPEIKNRQIADNLALEARQKAMLAELTPEQRALYDEYLIWRRR